MALLAHQHHQPNQALPAWLERTQQPLARAPVQVQPRCRSVARVPPSLFQPRAEPSQRTSACWSVSHFARVVSRASHSCTFAVRTLASARSPSTFCVACAPWLVSCVRLRSNTRASALQYHPQQRRQQQQQQCRRQPLRQRRLQLQRHRRHQPRRRCSHRCARPWRLVRLMRHVSST